MKGRSSLLAIVPGVLLGLLLVSPGADAQQKDDIGVGQKKLRQTQRELREQREKAAEARKREASVLAELEEMDRTIAVKKREVAGLTSQMAKLRTEIGTLRADIYHLEGRKALQQGLLAQRVRALYKIHAQGSLLPVVLASDDPVSRSVVLRHLATLAVVDARVIRGYLETTDQLAQRKIHEESRRAAIEALRSAADRERAVLDGEAERRRALLAKVRTERLYHERMVGELGEAARRLEALLRTLQERQRRAAKPPSNAQGGGASGSGFPSLRGGLPWPTQGRLAAPYGAQVHPRFGTRTFRSGIDIEAGEGTDVTAVYAGQVVYSGWFKGYGNLIILDHGDGYYTLYAHVAEITVKDGEAVRGGQRIGSVGDTGSLTGPRLYFEVRHQGKPQDPEQWLRQRG